MTSPRQHRINYYDRVVRITYIYLGPAADRFVTRQIANHLAKRPDELNAEDLPELINWIRLAMGFLTPDSTMVEEYIRRLRTLQETQPKQSKLPKHVDTTR